MTERTFYFTRKSEPDSTRTSWLISGVVMATCPEEAQRKLGALLAEKKSLDRGSDFSFADLSGASVEKHGVAAITIGRR